VVFSRNGQYLEIYSLPPSSAYICNYLITYITIIRNDIISCLCISLVFLTLPITFKHFEDQCFNLFLLDILTNTSYGLPIKYFKIWHTIISTTTNIYTIYECFCLVNNELSLWPRDYWNYKFRCGDSGILKSLYMCSTRNLKISHGNDHLLKTLICTHHNVVLKVFRSDAK
jgi:hypothetical protein